jgi:hypothetical protein
MLPRRIAAALAAGTAVVVVASCTTQVDGTGTGAGPHAGPSASAPPSAPATSSGAPSSSAGIHPVPAQPLRQATVHAGGADYRIKVWAEVRTADCAAHAYGAPMIAFLRQHPCNGLTTLLATTTVGGRGVGFAQRSIGFRGAGDPGYRTAGEFRALVSRSGTGNVNDLLREGYRLPSGPSQVPFPNAFDAQSQDDGVTVVEAWYLHGTTPDNDPALERMERAIYLQF